jgi:hypothetical protein
VDDAKLTRCPCSNIMMWPYIFTGNIAMWPFIQGQCNCDVSYRVRRGVILRHIGCGPKWMIWVSSDAPFWGDSNSGGPKLVTFLIRQKNTKYSRKAGSLKFDLSRFGQFNLYQDPFFEEIMNLVTELLNLAWAMCHTQNGDQEQGRGWVTFSDLFYWTCI